MGTLTAECLERHNQRVAGIPVVAANNVLSQERPKVFNSVLGNSIVLDLCPQAPPGITAGAPIKYSI